MTHDATHKTVDALWMIIFRPGLWTCRIVIWPQRLPIRWLWVNAIVWHLDYTRCNTSNRWGYSDALLMLCWRSVDALLTLCWRSVDDLLTLCWRSADAMLTLCWRYVDALLMLCWHSVDAPLTHCWRYVDTHVMLIFTCRNIDINHTEYKWGQYFNYG